MSSLPNLLNSIRGLCLLEGLWRNSPHHPLSSPSDSDEGNDPKDNKSQTSRRSKDTNKGKANKNKGNANTNEHSASPLEHTNITPSPVQDRNRLDTKDSLMSIQDEDWGLGPYMTANGIIEVLRPGILRSARQVVDTKH